MRVAAGVILAVAGAFALAGCGTGGVAKGHGDVRNGGTLFQSKCGACHALAAAATQGTIGPNLDAAFAADRQQGFKEETILNVVLDQMRLPSPPMPAADELFPVCKSAGKPQGCVTDQGAALEDVAAYVASTAGVNGSEPKVAAGGGGTDGKAIFSANCASCHTLGAAGSSGTVGPNLDQLQPPPTLAIVTRQVTNGGAVMPAFKGKLTAAQIDAVAKFVAASVAKK